MRVRMLILRLLRLVMLWVVRGLLLSKMRRKLLRLLSLHVGHWAEVWVEV